MTELKDRRILITGGAGFIGSNLLDALVEDNEVRVLDNFSGGAIENVQQHVGKRNFELIKGDVVDKEVVSQALKDVDIIFHLAAIVGVRHYVHDPIQVMKTNVHGTENLLELSLERSVERVVFASTSEVYGKNPGIPLKEDADRVLGSTKIDRWCYSTAKAVDEHLCYAYHRKHGLPVTVLRYFNVYGPRQECSDYGGVISIFIRRVLNDESPLVHGNGNQTRSFLYVSDAVNGSLSAATSKESVGAAINIGSSKETSIRDLALLIIKLAGKKERIDPKYIPYQDFYGEYYEDIPRRVPDVSMAIKMLGFKPKVSLEEGLKNTIAWYKQHLNR